MNKDEYSFNTPPKLDEVSYKKTTPLPNNDKIYAVMEKTLMAAVVEQRRSRRWGIFFKLLGFTYLLFIILGFLGLRTSSVAKSAVPSGEFTAVISVQGNIMKNGDADGETIIKNLRRAFENENAKGIILEINSGGGSPVQSGYVYDEIKRLRVLYPSKRLYAVIEDIGASGAYYIASAADEIYADKASLVGSIGVTGASFGFSNLIEKIGVERRVYTSGKHKAFLDPFQPMNPEETDFWKSQLSNVHEQFITVVRQGRGNRLKETPDLFSGLIWTGEKALIMGLIDGLGSSDFVAREIIKAPNRIKFEDELSLIDKISKNIGTSISSELYKKLFIENKANTYQY